MKRDNRMVYRVFLEDKKRVHGYSIDLVAKDEEAARAKAIDHMNEFDYKLQICSAKELCKLNRYLGGSYLGMLVPII